MLDTKPSQGNQVKQVASGETHSRGQLWVETSDEKEKKELDKLGSNFVKRFATGILEGRLWTI